MHRITQKLVVPVVVAAAFGLAALAPAGVAGASVATQSPVGIRAASAPLVNIVKPSITGQMVNGHLRLSYGSKATASAGAWTSVADKITYTFQWYENGKKVSGAIHSFHTVGLSAVSSHSISVAVTAHASHHTATTVMSNVEDAFPGEMIMNTSPALVLPSIVTVGSVVKTTPSSWTPSPTKLTYRWLRAGDVIPGATHNLHTIVADDCGKTLVFQVAGTRTGYASVGGDAHRVIVCAF